MIHLRKRHVGRRAAAILATTACVVGLSMTGVAGASASDRVAYGGSVPSWATHANDDGAAAADTSVEGEIYLPLRHAAAAKALANAVSTPGSRGYRHALSPKQWIQRFSPTQADLNAVVAYLKSKGLTISAVPKSRQYVVFRGTADQVGAAFATSLHDYTFAKRRLVASSSAPSLPASIATKVSGVSLDQSRLMTRPDSIKQGDLGAPATPQLH